MAGFEFDDKATESVVTNALAGGQMGLKGPNLAPLGLRGPVFQPPAQQSFTPAPAVAQRMASTNQAVADFAASRPQPVREAMVGYNPADGLVFSGGKVFNIDNATVMDHADKGGFLGLNNATAPDGFELVPVSRVKQYVDSIRGTETFAGELGRGVKRGADQLQGLAYSGAGLAGDLVGANAVRDWGLAGYERNNEEAFQNSARVGTYKDVNNFTDAAHYIAGGLGEAAPQLAAGFGVAGIGAKIGTSMLGSAATAAARTAAATRGATLGGMAYGTAIEPASIYGEIYEKTGEHAPGTALAYGIPAGLLEGWSEGMLFRGLMKGGIPAGGSRLGYAAKQAGQQFAIEGVGEELPQTFLEQSALRSIDPSIPYNTDEMIDATLKGGLGGGVVGGTVGLLTPRQRANLNTGEPTDLLDQAPRQLGYDPAVGDAWNPTVNLNPIIAEGDASQTTLQRNQEIMAQRAAVEAARTGHQQQAEQKEALNVANGVPLPVDVGSAVATIRQLGVTPIVVDSPEHQAILRAGEILTAAGVDPRVVGVTPQITQGATNAAGNQAAQTKQAKTKRQKQPPAAVTPAPISAEEEALRQATEATVLPPTAEENLASGVVPVAPQTAKPEADSIEDQTHAEGVRMFEAGSSFREIAEALGGSHTGWVNILKKYGRANKDRVVADAARAETSVAHTEADAVDADGVTNHASVESNEHDDVVDHEAELMGLHVSGRMNSGGATAATSDAQTVKDVNKAVKSFGATLTAHVSKQVEKLGRTFSTMSPQQQLLLLQTAKEGGRDLTPADVSEALKLKDALKTPVPENKLTKQREAEKESASIAEDNTQSNTLAEALLSGNTEAYVPLLEVLGGKNGFLVRQALRSRFGMPGSMNTPQTIADYFVGAHAKVSAAEAAQRASALAEGKSLWENTKGAGSWESLSLAQQAEFSVDAVEHADSPQVLEHLKGAYRVEDRTVSQERGEVTGTVSEGVESPGTGSVGLSRREEGERGTSGKSPSVSVKKKRTLGPQFSEGVAEGTDAGAIRSTLKKLFFSPEKFNQIVTVVQSASEIPADVKAAAAADANMSEADVPWDKVQGFALNGKVYMIADNMNPGAELGVFLHEVGVHLGMQKLIGKANMAHLTKQINQWAQKNDGSQESKLAKAALARAEDSSSTDTSEELIAYFIEEAVAAGVNPQAVAKTNSPLGKWFRTLWAAAKLALRKIGFGRFDDLTVQNLVDLAYGSAQNALTEGNASTDKIKFSEANATPKAFFSTLGEKVDDLLANPKGFIKEHGLGWLTLDQLADMLKSKAVSAYHDVMVQMQAFSKDRVAEASKIDHDWAKLSDAKQKQLSRVMRDATRAQFDPENEKAKTPEQATLVSQYNALGAEAKGIYKRVRDFYEANTEAKKAIMLDAANAAAKAGANTAEIKKLFAKMKGPYFPLMRLGDWYSVGMSKEVADLMAKQEKGSLSAAEAKRLSILRKDKTHYITRGHQSRREALRSEKELKAQFHTARFNRAQERIGNEASKIPDLQKVEAYIAADLPADVRSKVKEMMTQMYFDMLPEKSDLKRLMKREGIHGEEEDMRAVFASTAISSAHHISRLKYANDLSAAMVDVAKEGRTDETGRMAYNELIKRTGLAMDMQQHPVVDRLMQVSYFAHLGLSPAFILTNMTQVPMITLPWLGARHSFGTASRALAAAYADVTQMMKSTYAGKGADAWRAEFDFASKFKPGSNEHKLFTTMLDRNLLDITLEYDLGAVAAMQNGKLDDYIKMANMPVRVTETANRAVTILAAYRLAMAKPGTTHEQAVDHAARAVSETQLNYSALNAPRHMQSVLGSRAIARLMFQFRKYQQGMIWLVAKNASDALKGATSEERRIARRTLYGLFTTTGLMAGTVGVPFMGSAMAIATLIGGAFDDDDEPFDAATEYRNFLADVLGKDVAEVVAKGLPTLINLDLSKRVGMGDLGSPLPFARSGKSGPETMGNYLAAASGAAMGTMATTYDGITTMASGDLLKGGEKVVPLKAAQNLMRTARYNTEGMTNVRGEVVLPAEKFSAWDLALRAAGFSPTMESEYYEANRAVENAKSAAKDSRSGLLRDYAQAKMKGEDVAEVQQSIREFNQRHPEKGVRIDMSAQLKAVEARRKMAMERNSAGVRTDKATRPFLESGRFAGA